MVHPSFYRTAVSAKVLKNRIRNDIQGILNSPTAIVDTPDGILVVSESGRLFLLPGGGARHNESRRRAAIRELKEETGLKTNESTYLFSFKGKIHKDFRGGYFWDEHKVFLTAYSVKNDQKGTIANDISGEAQSVATSTL